jgi:hypothetical protein
MKESPVLRIVLESTGPTGTPRLPLRSLARRGPGPGARPDGPVTVTVTVTQLR